MDLGTLEKRLSEQKDPSRRPSMAISNPTSPAQSTTGKEGNDDSPNSSLTSPEAQKEQFSKEKKEEASSEEKKTEKKREEAVEELSDMMCSLVTNNCGETRYIGIFQGTIENSKLTSK